MLKDRDDLFKADARFDNLVRTIGDGPDFRRFTIYDLHEWVAPLSLTPPVPEDVRAQFDLARNTFVYSWFVYEMSILAEQQAYTVLEMAIKRRAALASSIIKRKGLRAAIDHCFEAGWLDRNDFEFGEYGAKYLKTDFLIDSRNELMHGSNRLDPWGSHMMLEFVHELIVRLFPSRE